MNRIFIVTDALRHFKAGISRALANPTRIAIVELLRDEGEVSVGRVHEALGIEQANASQHLSVLRVRNVVSARKDGNQVFYLPRDKLLGEVLDSMKKYFHAHLSESQEMLREIRAEKVRK
jgi:DNA-binding transcriptional ArsR family regulator